MRILQLAHDFLPNHVAGVEIYTAMVSRYLARTHDVAICYSEVVQELPDFTLRRGMHEGIQTYEIVNNHCFRRFEETWENPNIDRRVEEILDEFRPDVVHVQHLLNLSFGVVDAFARRDIPVLMTLHDHWLQCANGGQRFHAELGRCDSLDAERCGSCTSHLHGRGLGARGWLARQAATHRHASGMFSLGKAEPATVETVDPRFVYRDRYSLYGKLRPTWVAHPPSRLVFPIELERGGWFFVHCALHPETFVKPGPGVVFRVLVEGEARAERVLDPKRAPEDRQPVKLSLELGAGTRELELETRSTSSFRNDFCTAGWIDPCLHGNGGVVRAGGNRWRKPASQLVKPLLRMRSGSQARRIRARWKAVEKLMDRIDLFISPSSYLAREFVAFGLPEQKLRVADYGFDVTSFQRRHNLPQRIRRFAFIGSLVRHKGVHHLVKAFARMPNDAQLAIYGSPHYDPVYFDELRGHVGHGGIRFHGGVPPSEVPKVLQTVDALVVPSIWCENSPLTIHEAFLTGVPVVASRLGGNEELLRGGGGLLYDAEDVQTLYRLLRRLYEEDGLGRQLAAAAPPVRSLEQDAEGLLRCYEELIYRRRGRSAHGA